MKKMTILQRFQDSKLKEMWADSGIEESNIIWLLTGKNIKPNKAKKYLKKYLTKSVTKI